MKAHALGAEEVLLGRATLFGTAAGGRAGAERALSLLRREYELTLAHIGRSGIGDLGSDVLASDLPTMDRPWPWWCGETTVRTAAPASAASMQAVAIRSGVRSEGTVFAPAT